MPYRRLRSLPIVGCFDVLKDARLGYGSSSVPLSMNAFNFSSVQEALGHSRIVAGRSSHHITVQPIAQL